MSITNQFRVNTVTFTKSDGSQRTMNYISFSDLPQQFVSSFAKPKTMAPGYEVVWDVDNNGFRTINFNRQIGTIRTGNREVTITRG